MLKFDRNGFDSLNLFIELEALAEEERKKLLFGIEWLYNNQIDATLIGGMAVAHHLSVRRALTPDADVLVRDIKEVEQMLEQSAVPYQLLGNPNGGNPLGLKVESYNLDILDCRAWNIDLLLYTYNTAPLTKVNNRHIKVASPELLTISKLLTGRAKDIEDAFLLLKCPSIHRRSFIAALKGLGDETMEELYLYARFIAP